MNSQGDMNLFSWLAVSFKTSHLQTPGHQGHGIAGGGGHFASGDRFGLGTVNVETESPGCA